jgi:hypothetical protein
LRETRYGERERLAPQDLSSRDRRRGHRRAFDVGAGRISVDLQEYRTALLVGRRRPFSTSAIFAGMTIDGTGFIRLGQAAG